MSESEQKSYEYALGKDYFPYSNSFLLQMAFISRMNSTDYIEILQDAAYYLRL